MKNLFIWIAVIGCFAIVSACQLAQVQFKAEYDWVLPDFNYINQNNEEVGLSDLKGTVWLADFVFTNCDTVCPPMTANMARLQQEIAKNDLKVKLISFTVDPERDTPEALKEFASKFEADHSNWYYLTGYEQDEVKRLAKTFKTLAEAEDGTDQFTHSTKIYLINQEGIIVKGYNGLNVPYDEIIVDLKAISKN